MKCLAVIMIVLLSGCTVTCRVSGRLSEVDESAQALQEASAELANIKTAVNSMSAELQSAPEDIQAVDAVLSKYGIRRGTSAINEQK